MKTLFFLNNIKLKVGMGFLEHNSSYFCVLMGSLSTHEKKKPDFLKTNLHELISAKKNPIFVL